MSAVTTIPGFSLVNRWILYTGVLLAPAQFVSGLGNHCPSNLGFLAFNWYSQIQWYQAAKAQEMHALCLVLPHFTLIYTLSYFGGISSGNIPMGILLGLGTAGVLTLNVVASWTSWATNMEAGYGAYEFFFFGWRTLDADWHKFFLVWTIFDTLAAAPIVITAIVASVMIPMDDEDEDDVVPWWARYPAVPLGAILALLFMWPLILWTELIIARNELESATDYIPIWLFVAQVVTMLIPDCGLFKRRK